MTKALEVEVIPPVKMANNAILKNGNDTVTAKQLTKLFTESQNGMRRVIALGLFAWEIKELQLKHGEWGPWLAAHCPKLATIDPETKKPFASRALRGYMELTKSVLEGVGFSSIEKYLEEVVKFPRRGNMDHGRFLLIADKKVPDEIKPLRDKICELVDCKTQRQLFLEFKQADEDDDKPKRGRLKGSTGNTKEQRAAAAEREEQERVAELEISAGEIAEQLIENADAKNFGRLPDKIRAQLQQACEMYCAFNKQLNATAKGGDK